jgi:hypothetical protein
LKTKEKSKSPVTVRKRVSSLPVLSSSSKLPPLLKSVKKKKPNPIYTDVSVILDNDEGTDPEPFTLKINTNRIEPILPYKIASAKLPYR